MGPRRFACIRGFRRAHRGPGGYCRHSGNQGTIGRPARAHNILQKISLRTRLSKPGKPREGFSSARDLTKPKGSARTFASRGSFSTKPALPPRQSAHGLCARCRVTRASARSDDNAAVAVPVYKAVNKAAPSKADNETCHSGDKGTVCSYAPRATSPWDTPHLSGASPPSGWPVAFPAFVTLPPAVDRVHGPHLYDVLYLYCAPHLLLRRHVVALPAKIFGGKRPKTPIKGGGAHSR